MYQSNLINNPSIHPSRKHPDERSSIWWERKPGWIAALSARMLTPLPYRVEGGLSQCHLPLDEMWGTPWARCQLITGKSYNNHAPDNTTNHYSTVYHTMYSTLWSCVSLINGRINTRWNYKKHCRLVHIHPWNNLHHYKSWQYMSVWLSLWPCCLQECLEDLKSEQQIKGDMA